MIIYGRNAVLEALKSDFRSNGLYLQDGISHDDKLSEILEYAKSQKINIINLNSRELANKLDTTDSQGVGLDINFQTQNLKQILSKDENLEKSFIYITESSFQHNIGAIIRTAECAGLGGVILPPKMDITPMVVKVSTGAIFHIPIIKESIFNCIKEFEDNGYFIFGIERGGKSYCSVNLASPSLFIIGGEDKSVSDPVRKKCTEILEIPQFGRVNSLNMSVATSIVLYEQRRQIENCNPS